MPAGRPPLDLTGQRFGRLVVRLCLGMVDGRRRWSCECDCGTRDVVVHQYSLRSGATRSCGCLKRERAQSQETGQRARGPARLALVRQLRAQGLSFREIGERLGITGQRVYAVLRRARLKGE